MIQQGATVEEIDPGDKVKIGKAWLEVKKVIVDGGKRMIITPTSPTPIELVSTHYQVQR